MICRRILQTILRRVSITELVADIIVVLAAVAVLAEVWRVLG